MITVVDGAIGEAHQRRICVIDKLPADGEALRGGVDSRHHAAQFQRRRRGPLLDVRCENHAVRPGESAHLNVIVDGHAGNIGRRHPFKHSGVVHLDRLTQHHQLLETQIHRSDRALDITAIGNRLRNTSGARIVARAIHRDDLANLQIALGGALTVLRDGCLARIELNAVDEHAAEAGDNPHRLTATINATHGHRRRRNRRTTTTAATGGNQSRGNHRSQSQSNAHHGWGSSGSGRVQIRYMPAPRRSRGPSSLLS